MTYNLDGTIISLPPPFIKDAVFRHQDIVIKTKEKYPQEILFRFKKRIGGYIRPPKEGDEVSIKFIIRGWEYDKKYYVKLIGQKLTLKN